MKISKIRISALLITGALLTSSCVGSFSLFNKLASWNKEATDSKFLNELIFIVISPAYAICSMVDAVVLNSIEFWTGSNPLAQNIGKTQKMMGQDGKYYAVKTLKDGYEITKPDGSKMMFTYDKSTNSWSQEDNGKKTELFRFNEDGTIQANLANGRHINVTQDEAGLYKARMAANDGTYWAMR